MTTLAFNNNSKNLKEVSFENAMFFDHLFDDVGTVIMPMLQFYRATLERINLKSALLARSVRDQANKAERVLPIPQEILMELVSDYPNPRWIKSDLLPESIEEFELKLAIQMPFSNEMHTFVIVGTRPSLHDF